MPYTVKKIDVHVHTRAADSIPEGSSLMSPEKLRPLYDQLGIERGVLQLMPLADPDTSSDGQTNDAACELCAQFPDTLIPFIGLDRHMTASEPLRDLIPVIESYRQLGAKGVGEAGVNLPFDHPINDNMFRCCAECGMPVTIHLAPNIGKSYGIVDSLGLPGLEATLKKYPDLKIFGHSMMFWSAISGDVTEANMNGYPQGRVASGGRLIDLLREYGNLYCDMSAGSGGNAFTRDEEFAFRFIDEFSDRLLFGTDIVTPQSYTKLSGWLDNKLMSGCITQENYDKICRGNAIRLLKL